MNITQKTTLIIYGFVLFINAVVSHATVFSVVKDIFTWPGILGILIGIIALIRGNMPGWGIRNRGVAIVVIIVSFVYFTIMTYLLIYIYVLF